MKNVKTKKDLWFKLRVIAVILAIIITPFVVFTGQEIVFHEFLNTLSSFTSNLVYECLILAYMEGNLFLNSILVFLSLIFFIVAVIDLSSCNATRIKGFYKLVQNFYIGLKAR